MLFHIIPYHICCARVFELAGWWLTVCCGYGAAAATGRCLRASGWLLEGSERVSEGSGGVWRGLGGCLEAVWRLWEAVWLSWSGLAGEVVTVWTGLRGSDG